MYIVVSYGADREKTVYYYGMWLNYEAARRWAVGYHGEPELGQRKRFDIKKVERVA